jgi:hypothetical protein
VETAGRRIHGTTKEMPLARFDTIERAALLPLPPTPYALATWKKATLHPDCHVVFDHAFYSAPFRLIGQRLWIRGADTSVQIFHQHELVATHPRRLDRASVSRTPITSRRRRSPGCSPRRPRACVARTRLGRRPARSLGGSSGIGRSIGSGPRSGF